MEASISGKDLIPRRLLIVRILDSLEKFIDRLKGEPLSDGNHQLIEGGEATLSGG
jgi:hypothetical protein